MWYVCEHHAESSEESHLCSSDKVTSTIYTRLGGDLYDFAAVHLNLDVEVRYRAVTRALKPLVPKGASILEVGAGEVSIGKYLGRRTTAVDVAFDSRRNSHTEKIQASVCSLPFPDRAWDVVCSIDMLEHIPPSQRPQAIREMVRVGRKVVALAMPVGEAAYRHDLHTNEYYIHEHGSPHRFAREHVEFGLPDRAGIEDCLHTFAAQSGRKLKLRVVPNLNISFRSFYMKFAFHRSLAGRALYVGMFPIAYLGSIIDHGLCYREIFVCEIS